VASEEALTSNENNKKEEFVQERHDSDISDMVETEQLN
jgi:hypothetical protein